MWLYVQYIISSIILTGRPRYLSVPVWTCPLRLLRTLEILFFIRLSCTVLSVGVLGWGIFDLFCCFSVVFVYILVQKVWNKTIHFVTHHTSSVVSVSLSEEDVRGRLEVPASVSNWPGLCVGNCSSYKDKNSINMLLLFFRYSRTAHNWAQLSLLPSYQSTVLQQWMSFCYYLGYRIINAHLFIHCTGEFICLDFKLHMIKTREHIIHYPIQLTQMMLFEANVPVCCF